MRTGITAILLAGLLLTAPLRAADNPRPAAAAGTAGQAAPLTLKPGLPAAVQLALHYLLKNQHSSGGWGHFEVPPGRVIPPHKRIAASIPPPPSHFPPTVAETAAAVAAFIEAGQFTTAGVPDTIKRLQGAVHYLRGSVPRAVADPEDAQFGGMVERCAVTRTMLNPDVDLALALDALVAYRGQLVTPLHRADLIPDCHALIVRLAVRQQEDGTWPIDPKTGAVLQHNADGLAKDLAQGLGVHKYYQQFPKPVPMLGDALILRSLTVANRAGVPVEQRVIDLARNRIAEHHDARTGDAGGDGEHAFYRAAAVLNLLYHFDRDGSPDPNVAAARRAALDRAHATFFRKLRAINAPPAPKPPAAAAAPQNPLDTARRPAGPAPANPLDLDAPPPAASATTAPATPERLDKLPIPVPISSIDMVAYFLLLESIQNSTHPDARPLYDGLCDAIPRLYGRGGVSGVNKITGGWRDASLADAMQFHWGVLGGVDTDNNHPIPSNHLLTALAVRTLSLPRPPARPK